MDLLCLQLNQVPRSPDLKIVFLSTTTKLIALLLAHACRKPRSALFWLDQDIGEFGYCRQMSLILLLPIANNHRQSLTIAGNDYVHFLTLKIDIAKLSACTVKDRLIIRTCRCGFNKSCSAS